MYSVRRVGVCGALGGLLAAAMVVAAYGSRVNAVPCESNAGGVNAIWSELEVSCSCEGAQTHSAYVRCISLGISKLAQERVLAPGVRSRVLRCAKQSTCGRKGAVTCYALRGRASGRRPATSASLSCKIKRTKAHCVGRADGMAWVGEDSSCCRDAPSAEPCGVVPSVTTSTQMSLPMTTVTTVASVTSTTRYGACGIAIVHPAAACGGTCADGEVCVDVVVETRHMRCECRPVGETCQARPNGGCGGYCPGVYDFCIRRDEVCGCDSGPR